MVNALWGYKNLHTVLLKGHPAIQIRCLLECDVRAARKQWVLKEGSGRSGYAGFRNGTSLNSKIILALKREVHAHL
jgi:hypothetical protein